MDRMKVRLRNFRSIRDQSLDLAPLTIVYGQNGVGKSSLIYGILAMRNIVLNPAQTADAFFNLTFANLGGFEAVAFDHKARNQIGIEFAVDRGGGWVSYGVMVGNAEGEFTLSIDGPPAASAAQLKVSFPYQAGQHTELMVPQPAGAVRATWNGIRATAQLEPGDSASVAESALERVHAPIEALRATAAVPLKRGFSAPYYSPVPVTAAMITEQEVATTLASDKYLVSRVSHYLERAVGRDFRVNTQPGTAIFSLDATDRRTGIACELVNEGFGVNQLVHVLARALHKDSELICIEEPEIHLHPSAIRGVAAVLRELVRSEGKRFVISTHSEALIFSLLELVARRDMEPDDLAIYLASKQGKETSFERQAVNDGGQVEGGLASFVEAELESLRALTALSPAST